MSVELYDVYDYENGVSNCCGAKVYMTDVCSKCKEHCEVESSEEN